MWEGLTEVFRDLGEKPGWCVWKAYNLALINNRGGICPRVIRIGGADIEDYAGAILGIYFLGGLRAEIKLGCIPMTRRISVELSIWPERLRRNCNLVVGLSVLSFAPWFDFLSYFKWCYCITSWFLPSGITQLVTWAVFHWIDKSVLGLKRIVQDGDRQPLNVRTSQFNSRNIGTSQLPYHEYLRWKEEGRCFQCGLPLSPLARHSLKLWNLWCSEQHSSFDVDW